MELQDDFFIPTNEFQTSITAELLKKYPDEVVQNFLDVIETIPYVQNLISPNRKRAKDLPRDEEGKIIVDLTNPHILEDMDYFRQTAIHYQKYGCYTFLKPNKNPNSDYYKFFHEEIRRCHEGYIRKSDGEWITGYMYFYLNYCPIMLTDVIEGSKSANRIEALPLVWEGIYLRFHYLRQARLEGEHAIELARRGCSKSYTLAAIMAMNIVLGENAETTRRNMTVLAANNKEYLGGKDGTLTKFEPIIDYLSETTEFPRLRLNSSINDMMWRFGYKDAYNINRGSLNTVIGVSVKDDEGKLRGKRGYILFEEMGSFPNLLSTYNNTRYGVEEGEFTFGLMYLVGTAADDASDFAAAKELLYNTKGYNIKSLPNVYDKQPAQNKTFGYFYPAYLNRKGCDNKDGVSDVVKALLEILMKRYNTKMHSSDLTTILKVVAEMPITPAEAIIKITGSKFPIAAMTERLIQLESDKNITNSDYIVDLVLDKSGKVICKQSTATPIKSFPLKDEPMEGAIIIHEMPCKNSNGDVPPDRYVIGHDPVDNDIADSKSLASTFVLDLFTDTIVAELTGRQSYADLNYENVRLLCIFYNAKCLYESNKKGIYAYFNRMSSTHLLKNTPEYLREKDMVKYTAFGSNIKGVNASAGINNYADGLILEWLIKPVPVVIKENDEEKIITLPNLYRIKDIALLKELIAYNPDINVDRVRALGMVMLYREELMIKYNGDTSKAKEQNDKSDLSNDNFFSRNYDEKLRS